MESVGAIYKEIMNRDDNEKKEQRKERKEEREGQRAERKEQMVLESTKNKRLCKADGCQSRAGVM
jgi:hypothetical protein